MKMTHVGIKADLALVVSLKGIYSWEIHTINERGLPMLNSSGGRNRHLLCLSRRELIEVQNDNQIVLRIIENSPRIPASVTNQLLTP